MKKCTRAFVSTSEFNKICILLLFNIVTYLYRLHTILQTYSIYISCLFFFLIKLNCSYLYDEAYEKKLSTKSSIRNFLRVVVLNSLFSWGYGFFFNILRELRSK